MGGAQRGKKQKRRERERGISQGVYAASFCFAAVKFYTQEEKQTCESL